MKPDQFSRALATLQWSQADFARRTGVHAQTVNRWCNGHTSIPPMAVAYIELALAVKALPI
ncbi:helix-turn-helix domain-containing protein [Burkholderia gladioli]|uniref:helix-turn-helix domain-containing protein n=1 Tax=Burkholderia gladioli TaxID=28095 RepID=UPI00163DF2B0|nr:helix-turn-helix transcriptional regulator [Burkholderia gladioli]